MVFPFPKSAIELTHKRYARTFSMRMNLHNFCITWSTLWWLKKIQLFKSGYFFLFFFLRFLCVFLFVCFMCVCACGGGGLHGEYFHAVSTGNWQTLLAVSLLCRRIEDYQHPRWHLLVRRLQIPICAPDHVHPSPRPKGHFRRNLRWAGHSLFSMLVVQQYLRHHWVIVMHLRAVTRARNLLEFPATKRWRVQMLLFPWDPNPQEIAYTRIHWIMS